MPAQKRTRKLGLADWDQLRTVLAVFRGGTLSTAARSLKVDHTTIARRLVAMERDLNAALFERGPAGFVPTPMGEEVIAAAERMESEVDGLLRRLDGADVDLSGQVRLTTTPHLAACLIAPALGDLLGTHPGLQVELIGDNRPLDLSRREADVAVRLSRPDHPGLVARRIGSMAYACYASVADSRDFEAQRFLAYEEAASAVALRRYFVDTGVEDRIVMRSNSMQVLVEAARAGLGAAVLPCFAADSDAGLRRLPSPGDMPLLPLWLVYHEDLRRSPRVKAVVGFLDRLMRESAKRLVPEGAG